MMLATSLLFAVWIACAGMGAEVVTHYLELRAPGPPLGTVAESIRLAVEFERALAAAQKVFNECYQSAEEAQASFDRFAEVLQKTENKEGNSL